MFSPVFGIPLEMTLSIAPFSIVQVGLTGYGNVNREEIFGGLILTVALKLF